MSEEHFWSLSGMNSFLTICQLPNRGYLHGLSTHISTLIFQCKFPQLLKHREMLKLMTMQHAVQYHKARDLHSAAKTSPSSHIRPFSPIGKLLHVPLLAVPKGYRRRAEQTSPPSPQQPLQHHPYTQMPYLSSPSCNKCGYSHLLTNAWI